MTLASEVWLGQSGLPWTGASSHVDWPLHTATARENLQARGDVKMGQCVRNSIKNREIRGDVKIDRGL